MKSLPPAFFLIATSPQLVYFALARLVSPLQMEISLPCSLSVYFLVCLLPLYLLRVEFDGGRVGKWGWAEGVRIS